MLSTVSLAELLVGLIARETPLVTVLAGLITGGSPLVPVLARLEVNMVLSIALGFLWPGGSVCCFLDIASSNLPNANS